jgi:UDP-glucose 4-epimerase
MPVPILTPKPGHYLVTGGAGFIGSHLVDALLAAGHAVTVIDDLSSGRHHNLDRRARFIQANIADATLTRVVMAGMTGCFHLAAIASVARCVEEWVTTSGTNHGGTIAVMDAARHAGVPFVYASSAAVYGDQTTLPIHEDLPPYPRSAYGADKLGNELHARAGFITHGLSSVGFRFFNVYGPRQDPSSPYSGVISIFARRLAEGLPISVHGDGGQTRDFIAVADIVRFLLAGMGHAQRHPGALVLNACTGRATSIRELAEALRRLAHAASPIESGPARAGDIRHSVGDPTRAHAVLGLHAAIGLEQGLRGLTDA